MTAHTVLIVDDESVASTMASNIFQAEGYETIIAENGEEMHRIIATKHIDLILLDINLPGKNGLILAREIKEKNPDIAFIFVTGSDNEIDRILGLEIGADDYITKPFNPREVTIRAKNIINRTQKSRIRLEEAIKSVVLEANDTEPKPNLFSAEFYKFNGFVLDVNRHVLINPDNTETKLPKAEFRMLQYLCEHAKKLITRNELMRYVMGRERQPHDRTVDVTIRKLRQRLEQHLSEEVIETIHGEGYRFGSDVEQ